MSINWIDISICLVVSYMIIRGWQIGILYLVADLLSFLIALLLAFKYYSAVGGFIIGKFGIPQMWKSVVGYFIVAAFAEIVISNCIYVICNFLPSKLVKSKANRILGVFASILNAVIIVTFFLFVILSLPFRGTVKHDIFDSFLGNKLISLGKLYGGRLTASLDDLTNEALKFITVKPDSKERVYLDIPPPRSTYTISTKVEEDMLELINEERSKYGINSLSVNESLKALARDHCMNMFENGYFSHIDLQERDVSARAKEKHINYRIIGENLAYAPDVKTAHRGLMASEGHRDNILDPQFKEVGIGAIDAGLYGMMFVQVFVE